MKGIFTEEFLDDLATRVARKLAERYYKNNFFEHKQQYNTQKNVYSGCGSETSNDYDRCGNLSRRKTTNYGCGSGTSNRGGC